MRWPWTHASAEPPVTGGGDPRLADTSATPATSEPARPTPVSEWQSLQPLHVAADAAPLGTTKAFLATLATRQTPPPMLQRLSHDTSAAAPAGIAVGVARGLAPALPARFDAPAVKSARPRTSPTAPVQHRRGLGYWLGGSRSPETRVRRKRQVITAARIRPAARSPSNPLRSRSAASCWRHYPSHPFAARWIRPRQATFRLWHRLNP